MLEQICFTDVVLDSIREVFDTMIFMAVEPLDVEKIDKANEMLLGSITFKGDLEGCLSFCTAVQGAKTVAANMLCLDSPDEVGEEDLADAMGEVCNMVMGSIKTRLQDTIPNIELSIPSVIAGHAIRTSLGEGAQRSLVNVNLGGSYEAELSFVCRAGG
ncbi:MAG: chemotaxis protein CheX [Chlorobiales bacterium]|nr:chemotaxis protein CheX [Chlorobiales bacterium]